MGVLPLYFYFTDVDDIWCDLILRSNYDAGMVITTRFVDGLFLFLFCVIIFFLFLLTFSF